MTINQPTVTPTQLNMYSEPITHIYRALEDEIFLQIAKRLKTTGIVDKDKVLEWQVEKMNDLRLINKETVRALSKTTGIAEKEIRKAIHDVGIDSINSVDHELVNHKETLPTPTQTSVILDSYVNQTFRELDNFVNQSLINTQYGRGTVSRTYQKIVEETTAKVMTGTTTTNQAVAETVIKWSKRGINTGFVDKGGNVWNVENYARTVVRSTVNRTYNDLRMSRMDEYNVDLVLVSALPDPRVICGEIQGKVASMKKPGENKSKYPSIYNYGYETPGGIRGINCRHTLFPFIEGLNENNQPQYSQEEMARSRELRQKQRYHERQVREAKRSLKLAEEIGEKEVIEKQKKLLRNRQASTREFVRANDLTRRYDLEKVII